MESPLQNPTDEKAPNSSCDAVSQPSWTIGVASLIFIVLQSSCTAVLAISGVRLLIGLSALAAAAGLHPPAYGWHRDAIRIPLMIFAVGGSIINLYSVWRIRSLRARPSSQWRMQPPSPKQIRMEKIQITVAMLTLFLVASEYAAHLIVRLDLPFLRGR